MTKRILLISMKEWVKEKKGKWKDKNKILEIFSAKNKNSHFPISTSRTRVPGLEIWAHQQDYQQRVRIDWYFRFRPLLALSFSFLWPSSHHHDRPVEKSSWFLSFLQIWDKWQATGEKRKRRDKMKREKQTTNLSNDFEPFLEWSPWNYNP